MPMRRMGIIDGDPLFAKRVRRVFEAEGYEVEWFNGTTRALPALLARTFDLLLIDSGEDGAGLELCRGVRREALRNDVPIIATTMNAGAHPETLAAGADESVVKTLSMRELVARSRAVVRRASQGWHESAAYADQTLEIFPDSMRIIREGRQVLLSKGESDVLALLIRHAPASLPVDRIRTELSATASSVSRSAIEARLKSLRRKIGRELIVNRIGFGYSFAAPRDQAF